MTMLRLSMAGVVIVKVWVQAGQTFVSSNILHNIFYIIDTYLHLALFLSLLFFYLLADNVGQNGGFHATSRLKDL